MEQGHGCGHAMTTLNIPQPDHLHEAVLHAHADMQVALKMHSRGLLLEAWQKVQQGYDRLEKALDTAGNKEEITPPLISVDNCG